MDRFKEVNWDAVDMTDVDPDDPHAVAEAIKRSQNSGTARPAVPVFEPIPVLSDNRALKNKFSRPKRMTSDEYLKKFYPNNPTQDRIDEKGK